MAMSPTIEPGAAAALPVGPRKTRGRFQQRRDLRAGALFLLPSAILFLAFVAGPVIACFIFTFYQWDGLSSARFIGADNYRTLAHDQQVRTVLGNTLVFVIGDVAGKIAIGLFLAVTVTRYVHRALQTIFRSVIFFPVIVSGVAVGIIWVWLLNTSLGVVNYYLGYFGLPTVAWLDSSQYALPSLMIVDIWRNVGFSFVVFTAGIQGIPAQQYEAAEIDGAGEWAKLRWITLPLLSPTTYFLIVINLINAFQFFDLSYVMTQGGPGDASRTIVYYIYDTAFHFFRFGYGSTIALLLFLILAVLTFVQVRLSRRWVFYS
jgi:multiple sugar transport system permease protein